MPTKFGLTFGEKYALRIGLQRIFQKQSKLVTENLQSNAKSKDVESVAVQKLEYQLKKTYLADHESSAI